MFAGNEEATKEESTRLPAAFSQARSHVGAGVVVVFALGVVLRMPAFTRPMLSDDEAIYATTADAMMRGDLLYRDVVDHKPPLIYHVYQAGFALLGRYNTHGAHALVLLAVLLTAALLGRLRWREDLSASPRLGLAAAGLFLVFSTTWHDYDALAANCELFLLAPQVAAAWLVLRDFREPARGLRALGLHTAIGALVGVSVLLKYQGLTFLGVSVGMLGWAVLLGRISWARGLSAAVVEGVGSLLPAALYLCWCVSAGNAEAAVYWFKFNFSYVGAGLTGLAAMARALWRLGLIGGVAVVPYALGLWGAASAAVSSVRTGRARLQGAPISQSRDGEAGLCPAEPERGKAWKPSQGFHINDLPRPSEVLGLLWLATSAVALAAGGRFFGHYFHLILAPLCILAAPRFVRLWLRGRAFRAALVALCALPALVFFALATWSRPWAAVLDEGEPPYDDVAARMAALTASDERVFVWGNSPQLYVSSRRPMGARFSFCNYMTGESPGTPTESGLRDADSNQLPAAWDMLFADLDQRRPALFVDAAAAQWDGYEKFPLSRYPRLRSYVNQHYRQVEIRDGVVLYRRVP